MAETPQAANVTELLASSVGAWRLDAVATSIELRTKAMWGLAKVKAFFAAVEGSGVVTADGAVSGTLVVDAASVDTGNAKRDNHLRSKDFFEVDAHPSFAYSASAVRPAANGSFAVSGSLTIHGQTRPLDLVASATHEGSGRVLVTAEVDLDRREWGLTWAKMGAGMDNHIVVNAVFTRQ